MPPNTKAMSYGRMKQDIARLKQEIAQLLDQTEETDARENEQYDKDKRSDKPETPSPSTMPMAKLKTEEDATTGKMYIADSAHRNFIDAESCIRWPRGAFVQGRTCKDIPEGKKTIINPAKSVARDSFRFRVSSALTGHERE